MNLFQRGQLMANERASDGEHHGIRRGVPNLHSSPIYYRVRDEPRGLSPNPKRHSPVSRSQFRVGRRLPIFSSPSPPPLASTVVLSTEGSERANEANRKITRNQWKAHFNHLWKSAERRLERTTFTGVWARMGGVTRTLQWKRVRRGKVGDWGDIIPSFTDLKPVFSLYKAVQFL